MMTIRSIFLFLFIGTFCSVGSVAVFADETKKLKSSFSNSFIWIDSNGNVDATQAKKGRTLWVKKRLSRTEVEFVLIVEVKLPDGIGEWNVRVEKQKYWKKKNRFLFEVKEPKATGTLFFRKEGIEKQLGFVFTLQDPPTQFRHLVLVKDDNDHLSFSLDLQSFRGDITDLTENKEAVILSDALFGFYLGYGRRISPEIAR